MPPSTPPQSLPLTPLAAAVAMALLSMHAVGPRVAFAAPTEGQVAAGAATIQQSGTQTVINQSTARAAINWQSFGIAANEAVIFRQPSSSSVALNRVVGSDPSAIYGSLQANGHVFLINPNGVLFARGANVDVAGLVASTLGISNNDFMNGRYVFSGGSGAGSVVNEATIRMKNGGYVALLGNQVFNTGTIVASNGTVALGAGESMVLDFHGDGLLSLRVNAAAANAKIGHSGEIHAAGGAVIMSAAAKNALLDTVLNVEGIVTAKGIVERGGYIYLDGGRSGVTQVSGTLDASSVQAKGGEIRVLGENVGLFGNAKLDASGASGGGTVLIGGDFQGLTPDIPNASRAYVGRDATIRADATAHGDGGKVIVWADDTTKYYGSISARGGARGGNGGFAEVSGKGVLVYDGTADLRAPHGRAGTLLLDPTDITVANGGADSASDGAAFANASCGAGSSGTCTISPDALDAAGANVVLQAQNDITVVNRISLETTPDANLTLQAGRSITLNARVGTNGAGRITLVANNTDNSETDAAGGALLAAGGANRSAGAGNLTINGRLTTGTGAIRLVSSGATANGGTPGNVAMDANVTTSGNVTIAAAGGAITQTAGVISGEALSLRAATGIGSAGGDTAVFTDTATLTATNSASGNIDIVNAGDVSVSASNTGGGALKVTASSGRLTVNAGNINADAGSVTLQANEMTLTGTVTGNGGVTLRPHALGLRITLGLGTDGLDFTNAALARVHTTGTLTIGGDATPSSGDIFIDGPITAPAGWSTLSLRTGARIVDANAAPGADITVTNLALRAANGIGTSDDPLETAVSHLAFSNTGSGAVAISNVGPLTLTAVDGLTTSGGSGNDTTLVATGPITVAMNLIQGGSISLTTQESAAAAAGDDLIVLDGRTVRSEEGDVTLRAGDRIVLAGSSVVQASGTVALTAGFGDNDGAGAIAGTGTARGSHVALDSLSGIGDPAARFNTRAATLAARSTAGGGVFISEFDAVTLSAVGAVDNRAAGGPYDIVAAGRITVSGVVNTGSSSPTRLATTSGDIQVDAALGNASAYTVLASAGSIGGGATVTGSAVTLDSATGVNVRTSADLLAARTTVSGTVLVDEIDSVAVGTIASVGNGAVASSSYSLTAGGSITVSGAVNPAGTGATTLRTTSGDILLDANVGNAGGATFLFSAGAITGGGTAIGQSVGLDSATGVGSAAARVNTAAEALAARSASSGGVFVSEADGVTLSALCCVSNGAAGGSPYDLIAGGSIAVTAGVNSSGSGSTTLRTTAGGNIVLGGTVGNATAGTVIISSGNITSSSSQARATGVQVTLDSATGIGAVGNRVNTSAGTLAARSRVSGGVFLNEQDEVTLSAIGGAGNGASGGGAYDLVANNTITVADAVNAAGAGATRLRTTSGDIVLEAGVGHAGAATVLRAAGSIAGAGTVTGTDVTLQAASVGTATARIKTIANTLAVSSSGGDAFVAEADAVTLNTIGGVDNAANRYDLIAGGSITVSGAVNADSGATVLTTTSGNVVVDANLGSPSGATVITSAGRISGSGTVRGGDVTLDSASGVGTSAAARLGVSATTLAARSRTGGGVFVSEENSVALNTLGAVANGAAANAAYDVVAGGTLTFESDIAAGAGAVTLSTPGTLSGGAGRIVSTGVVALSGSRIGTAANPVLLDLGGAGTVSATTSGAIGLSDSGAGGLRTSRIAIVAPGSGQPLAITQTGLGGIIVDGDIGDAARSITLTATAGAITGGAGTVRGAGVILDSATGVGAAGLRVHTAATTLAARTVVTGGVFVAESDAVTLSPLGSIANGAAGGGAYDLTAGGTITLENGIATGAGAVTLTATGAGEILRTGGVIASTGAVTLSGRKVGETNAPILLDLGGVGSVSATSRGAGAFGEISLHDVAQAGLATSRVAIATAAGSAEQITITQSGAGFTVDGAIGNNTDHITLRTPQGAIAGGAGTVAGAEVILDASAGVGTSAARVRTAAATLSARSLPSGGVFITEADAVTLNTTGGVSNFAPAGETFDVSAGGDIVLNASVGDTNTAIVLRSSGSITGSGRVSGTSVTLDSATGIGVSASDRVNTAAQTLAARSTSSGGVFISQNGAVTLDVIGGVGNAAAGAAYDLNANTDIVVAANVGNAGVATVLTAGGSITGSGTVRGTDVTLSASGRVGTSTSARLNTAADVLAVSVNGGGAFIAEADAVTLGTIGGVDNIGQGSGYDLRAGGAITVAGPVNVNTSTPTRLATTSGDIVVGANVGNGPGATVLTSAGTITGTGRVSGADVTLDSATGVGTSAAARLNTAAGTLAARSRTSGGVFVAEQDFVTLNTIGGVGNGAPGATYDVAAGTGITLEGDINAGAVTLAAGSGHTISGGAGRIVSAGAVTLSGSNIGTDSNPILLDLGGVGTVTATSTAGPIALSDGAAAGLETSRLTLTTPAVSLEQISITQTGAGGITVNANFGDGTDNIKLVATAGKIAGAGTVGGAHVVLDGATGVGTSAAARVNTAAGFLTARTSASGGVFVAETDAVALREADAIANGAAGGGAYDLTAGGTITLESGIATGAGAVTLTATGAGEILRTDGVIATTGAVTLNAVKIGSSSQPIALDLGNAGSVSVTTSGAGVSGEIGLADTAAAGLRTSRVTVATDPGSAQSILIRQTGAGGITVDGALGNSTDFLTLRASAGSIAGGAGTLTGAQIALEGQTGVGTNASRVNTAAAVLAASSVTSGGVFVSEADAIELTTLSSVPNAAVAGETYSVTAGGTLTVTGNLNTVTGSTTTLATTGGGIVVNADVGNIGAATVLVSSGSIIGSGRIQGASVTLDSALGVGVNAGTRMRTAAGTLEARSTVSGGVFVEEQDGVTLNTLGSVGNSAFGVAYDLNAGQDIVVAGTVGKAGVVTSLTTSGTGTLTGAGLVMGSDVSLSASAGIGTALSRVNTAADTLALRSTSGSIFVSEANAVTLNTIGSIDNQASGAAYDLTAGGTITVSGSVNVTGAATTALAATVGDIVLSATAGNPSAATVLSSAGTLAGPGLVQGTSVTLDSATGVGVSAGARLGTSASTLAARTRTSGGVFLSSGSVALDAIGPVANTTAGGIYDLSASGNVAVTGSVDSGAARTTLNATGGISGAGAIGSATAGNSVELVAANSIDATTRATNLAASATNGVTISNTAPGGLTVTTVGGTTGITTTNNGAIALTQTGAGSITIAAAINSGSGNTNVTSQGGSILGDGVSVVTGGFVGFSAAAAAVGVSGTPVLTSTPKLGISVGTSFFVENLVVPLSEIALFLLPTGASTYSLASPGLTFDVTNPAATQQLNVNDIANAPSLNFFSIENLAGGDIGVGSVATAGSVTIRTSGAASILDDGNNLTRVTGTRVSLITGSGPVGVAGTEIGTSTPELTVSAGSFAIDNGIALSKLDLTLRPSGGASAYSLTSPGLTFTVANLDGTTLNVNDVTSTSALELRMVNAGAAGQITSGKIDVAGQNVELRSESGSILDDGDNLTRIVANRVNLSAPAGAIGAAGPNHEIDTSTGGLDLSVGTNLFLDNGGGTLTNLSLRASPAGGALYSLTSTGLVFNVTNPAGTTLDVAQITQSPGPLTLSVTNAATAGALSVSTIGAGTGDVTLTAGGAIDQPAGAITANLLTTRSAGGTTLNRAGNAIDNFDAINTTAGSVALTNSRALVVDGISNSGREAALTVSGAISQSGAIVVSQLTTSSDGGTVLGHGGNVIPRFAATNTTAGNVELFTDSALDLPGIANAAGNVTLTAAGALSQSAGTIAGNALTTSSVGGTVLNRANAVNTFTASNSVSGVVAFSNAQPLDVTGVSNGAGDISLRADSLTLSGAVNTALNRVTLAPFTSTTSIQLGNGAMNRVDFGSNFTTANVTASKLQIGEAANTGGITVAGPYNPGIGTLHLVTGGAIDDTTGGGTNIVTAPNLALSAATGIGTTNPISVSATSSLAATNATSGGISIRSDGSVTVAANVDGVTGVTSPGAGTVTLAAGNALTVNAPIDAGSGKILLIANQDGAGSEGFANTAAIQTTSPASDALRILVNTAGGGQGNALIGADITALTGTISIDVKNSSPTGGNIATTAGTLTANAISLTAGGQVGSSSQPIKTSTNALSISAGGTVFVTEANGLTALDVDAGTNNVALTVTLGAVSDSDAANDITGGSATITLSDAAARNFGSASNPIQLHVPTLSLTTGAGDVFVRSDTALNVQSLTTQAGVPNTIDIRTTGGTPLTLSSFSGLAGSGTARDGDALTLATDAAGGTVNIANALAAGSITVNAGDRITTQALTTSNVDTSATFGANAASGAVTLITLAGGISTGAISTGTATAAGGSATSGAITISAASGGINLGPLATGAAAGASAASGAITLEALAGGLGAIDTLTTGAATGSGSGGAASAVSGAVRVSAVAASVQTGLITTGAATLTNGGTTESGSISLSGASVSQSIVLGAASGGTVNTGGALDVAASAGNISITSTAPLRIRDIATQADTANTVGFESTGGESIELLATGTYAGLRGSGSAADGDALTIGSTSAAGTVTFGKALEAGSITVTAGGAIAVAQGLSTSAVDATAIAGIAAQSGAIVLTAGAGDISVTGELRTGAARATGPGATATSGSISINAAAGGISGSSALTTGTATAAGADATSGFITLTASAGSVSGNGAATTGDATADGTGTSVDVRSGGIQVSAAGAIQRGLLTTGAALVVNADPGNSASSTSGGINLDGGHIGTNEAAPQAVAIGSAAGSLDDNSGSVTLTSRGVGAGGNIFVSSAAPLRVSSITTESGSAQVVDLRTTNGSPIALGSFSGLGGDGTLPNGDTLNIVTAGPGGTVNFSQDLAAGSITVNAGGGVSTSNLSTSNVDASANPGTAAASGAIVLSAVTGDIVTGDLTTGTATAAGTHAVSGAITLAAGGRVEVSSVSTGAATSSGGNATSGAITFGAASGGLTADDFHTGHASATGGSATSGRIGVTAAGADLSTGTITTGAAAVLNPASAGDTARTGDIALSARSVGSDDTPQVVTIGSPTGGALNTAGAITLTGSGTGAGGNLFVISDAPLTTGAVSAGAGASIDIRTTGDSPLTVGGAMNTADNPTGDSGSITLRTREGDIIINAAVRTGAATLAGTGDAAVQSGAIDVQAGTHNDVGSIRGTGSLVTGHATLIGGTAGDSAQSGGITLRGTRISSDGGMGRFGVGLGNATAGTGTATSGQLSAITDGTGAAGDIRLAGAAQITTGQVRTEGEGAAIDIDAGANPLTLEGAMRTRGAPITLRGAGIASTASGTISTRSQDEVAALDAGSVSITATETGSVNLAGSIDTRGAEGRAGGAVTLTTADGAITVASIDTTGDNASGAGGAGGSITFNAGGAKAITLNGTLSSRGGGGSTVGGAAGDVVFNGRVILGGSITIDTRGGDGEEEGDVGRGTSGNVRFAGTLDGATPFSQDLTLRLEAGSVAFEAAVGGSAALGDIRIDSANHVAGSLDGGTAAGAITARSFTHNAGTGIARLSSVTTAGAADADGGNVSINSAGALFVGAIDTRGGIVVTGTDGRAGGEVTLTSPGDLIVAGINTSGSAALAGSGANGGNAGAISLRAGSADGGHPEAVSFAAGGAAPKIVLTGDIIAEGGAADGAGTGGNGASLRFEYPVVLGASVTVATRGGAGGMDGAAGSGGSINFEGAVDADSAAANRALTVTAGNSDVTFSGDVGAAQALGDLTASADSVRFEGASVLARSIDVAALGTIRLDANLATRAVDTSATPGASALSGGITLSARNGVGGAGTLTTGSATADGSTGAATTARSGSISVTTENANLLMSLITTGAATIVGASGNDTASTGNISLSGASVGDEGPQAVVAGTASGGNVNAGGVLNLAATNGSIFVTSDAPLRVQNISTQADVGNRVDVRTTNGQPIELTASGVHTGVKGSGTAADGDDITITTDAAGGMVTFSRAIEAGSITVNAFDSIRVSDLSTSAVASATPGTNATSGGITLTSASGEITGAGALTTGAATALATGIFTSATSGSIELVAAGAIAVGLISTGNASVVDAVVDGGSAETGGIALNAMGIGASLLAPQAVAIGATTGGTDGANTPGRLAMTSTGAGAAGDIFIASGSPLDTGTVSASGPGAAIDIRTSGASPLRLFGAMSTVGGHVTLSAAGIASTSVGTLSTVDGAGAAGAVTLTATGQGAIDLQGNVDASGSAFSAAGGNVTVTTTDGALTVSRIFTAGGDQSDVAGNAGAGGDIILTVGGAHALEVGTLISDGGSQFVSGDAGSAGRIVLNGGVGSITLYGAISAAGGNNTTGTGNAGAGRGIVFGRPVVLRGAVSINTSGGAASGGGTGLPGASGDVRFMGAVDATALFEEGLQVLAGAGNVSFEGAVGSVVPLVSLDVQGGNVAGSLDGMSAAPTIRAGRFSADAQGATRLSAVDTSGGTTPPGGYGASAGPVTIGARTITIGSITARGGDGVEGGSGGVVALAASDPAGITLNGNVILTGGNATGADSTGGRGGAFVTSGATFVENIEIDARPGTSAPNGVLAFGGFVQFGGPLTLQGDLVVQGGREGINFGSIDADLAANNRKLTVSAPLGTVTFSGDIGAMQALADLDVTAGPHTIVFNADAPQSVNVSAGGGNTVTFNGPVRLDQRLSVNTDGASDNSVTFNGSVNAATSGAQSLTLTTGTGRATLGPIGNAQELGALAAAGSVLTLNGDVRLNGGGAADLRGVATVRVAPSVLIDTDRTGGTRGAGDVLFGPLTRIEPAGTLSMLTLDVLADGGGAPGRILAGIPQPGMTVLIFGRLVTPPPTLPVSFDPLRAALDALDVGQEDLENDRRRRINQTIESEAVEQGGSSRAATCTASQPNSLSCD